MSKSARGPRVLRAIACHDPEEPQTSVTHKYQNEMTESYDVTDMDIDDTTHHVGVIQVNTPSPPTVSEDSNECSDVRPPFMSYDEPDICDSDDFITLTLKKLILLTSFLENDSENTETQLSTESDNEIRKTEEVKGGKSQKCDTKIRRLQDESKSKGRRKEQTVTENKDHRKQSLNSTTGTENNIPKCGTKLKLMKNSRNKTDVKDQTHEQTERAEKKNGMTARKQKGCESELNSVKLLTSDKDVKDRRKCKESCINNSDKTERNTVPCSERGNRIESQKDQSVGKNKSVLSLKQGEKQVQTKLGEKMCVHDTHSEQSTSSEHKILLNKTPVKCEISVNKKEDSVEPLPQKCEKLSVDRKEEQIKKKEEKEQDTNNKTKAGEMCDSVNHQNKGRESQEDRVREEVLNAAGGKTCSEVIKQQNTATDIATKVAVCVPDENVNAQKDSVEEAKLSCVVGGSDFTDQQRVHGSNSETTVAEAKIDEQVTKTEGEVQTSTPSGNATNRGCREQVGMSEKKCDDKGNDPVLPTAKTGTKDGEEFRGKNWINEEIAAEMPDKHTLEDVIDLVEDTSEFENDEKYTEVNRIEKTGNTDITGLRICVNNKLEVEKLSKGARIILTDCMSNVTDLREKLKRKKSNSRNKDQKENGGGKAETVKEAKSLSPVRFPVRDTKEQKSEVSDTSTERQGVKEGTGGMKAHMIISKSAEKQSAEDRNSKAKSVSGTSTPESDKPRIPSQVYVPHGSKCGRTRLSFSPRRAIRERPIHSFVASSGKYSNSVASFAPREGISASQTNARGVNTRHSSRVTTPNNEKSHTLSQKRAVKEVKSRNSGRSSRTPTPEGDKSANSVWNAVTESEACRTSSQPSTQGTEKFGKLAQACPPKYFNPIWSSRKCTEVDIDARRSAQVSTIKEITGGSSSQLSEVDSSPLGPSSRTVPSRNGKSENPLKTRLPDNLKSDNISHSNIPETKKSQGSLGDACSKSGKYESNLQTTVPQSGKLDNSLTTTKIQEIDKSKVVLPTSIPASGKVEISPGQHTSDPKSVVTKDSTKTFTSIQIVDKKSPSVDNKEIQLAVTSLLRECKAHIPEVAQSIANESTMPDNQCTTTKKRCRKRARKRLKATSQRGRSEYLSMKPALKCDNPKNASKMDINNVTPTGSGKATSPAESAKTGNISVIGIQDKTSENTNKRAKNIGKPAHLSKPNMLKSAKLEEISSPNPKPRSATAGNVSHADIKEQVTPNISSKAAPLVAQSESPTNNNVEIKEQSQFTACEGKVNISKNRQIPICNEPGHKCKTMRQHRNFIRRQKYQEKFKKMKAEIEQLKKEKAEILKVAKMKNKNHSMAEADPVVVSTIAPRQGGNKVSSEISNCTAVKSSSSSSENTSDITVRENIECDVNVKSSAGTPCEIKKLNRTPVTTAKTINKTSVTTKTPNETLVTTKISSEFSVTTETSTKTPNIINPDKRNTIKKACVETDKGLSPSFERKSICITEGHTCKSWQEHWNREFTPPRKKKKTNKDKEVDNTGNHALGRKGSVTTGTDINSQDVTTVSRESIYGEILNSNTELKDPEKSQEANATILPKGNTQQDSRRVVKSEDFIFTNSVQTTSKPMKQNSQASVEQSDDLVIVSDSQCYRTNNPSQGTPKPRIVKGTKKWFQRTQRNIHATEEQKILHQGNTEATKERKILNDLDSTSISVLKGEKQGSNKRNVSIKKVKDEKQQVVNNSKQISSTAPTTSGTGKNMMTEAGAPGEQAGVMPKNSKQRQPCLFVTTKRGCLDHSCSLKHEKSSTQSLEDTPGKCKQNVMESQPSLEKKGDDGLKGEDPQINTPPSMKKLLLLQKIKLESLKSPDKKVSMEGQPCLKKNVNKNNEDCPQNLASPSNNQQKIRLESTESCSTLKKNTASGNTEGERAPCTRKRSLPSQDKGKKDLSVSSSTPVKGKPGSKRIKLKPTQNTPFGLQRQLLAQHDDYGYQNDRFHNPRSYGHQYGYDCIVQTGSGQQNAPWPLPRRGGSFRPYRGSPASQHAQWHQNQHISHQNYHGDHQTSHEYYDGNQYISHQYNDGDQYINHQYYDGDQQTSHQYYNGDQQMGDEYYDEANYHFSGGEYPPRFRGTRGRGFANWGRGFANQGSGFANRGSRFVNRGRGFAHEYEEWW